MTAIRKIGCLLKTTPLRHELTTRLLLCYETETIACVGVDENGTTKVTDSHIPLNIGVHGEYSLIIAGSSGYKLTVSHRYIEVHRPVPDAAHINA